MNHNIHKKDANESVISPVVLHELASAGAHSCGFSNPHSQTEKYIFLACFYSAADIGGYLTLGDVPSV